MAIVLKDRVKQSASAPGTGTITLGSTPTGFQAFSAIGNGNVTYFAIVDSASGAWEVNYGTYTSSGTTLTRNATPLSSSAAGALVNFTGTVDVFCTYPSEKAIYEETTGNVLIDGGPITVIGDGVTTYTTFDAALGEMYANINSFAQFYAQNLNGGSSASTDIVAYNDLGDGSTNFIDMGISSSNYSDATYPIFTAGSGYVYNDGGELIIGSATDDVLLFAGGVATTDWAARIDKTSKLLTTKAGVSVGSTLAVTGAATFSSTVALSANPTTALQAATKQYVDNQVTAGIHIHEPVLVTTTGNLTATYTGGGTNANIIQIANGTDITFFSVTPAVGDQFYIGSSSNGLLANTAYFVVNIVSGSTIQASLTFGGAIVTGLTNGSPTIPSVINSGVGAKLTNSGAQAALSIDGVSLSTTNRVLVRNQTTASQNGVYTVTTVGSGATNWELTRATDSDRVNPSDPDGVGTGDYFYVQSGTNGAGDSFVLTTEPNTMIIGYTNLTYTQFSGAITYVGGTNIDVTGQTISVTGAIGATNGGTGTSTVATGDLLYGSGTNTWGKLAAGAGYKSLVMNAGGTNVEWNAVALNQSGAVSGNLPATNGGTGLGSYTLGDIVYSSAANTLAALAGNSTTTKKYLIQTGTGAASAAPEWGTINGADVSGNISGSAGSVANALTLGSYLTGTSFNGSSAVTATVDATSANTASKVVARDASGNFSAGTITATLSGSATSATTATNLAGGTANQIPFQASAGTTSFATAPSATGQFLGWNGSAFAWSVPSPSAATPTALGTVYGKTTASGTPYNTFLGYYAGNITTGTNNTFVGYNAGVLNSSGAFNSAFGYNAGAALTTGQNNVIIGRNAAWTGTNDLTTGSNNIIIGANAGSSSASATNEVTIGDTSIGSTRLRGIVEHNMAIFEQATISATAATGTIAYYARSQSVLYYTSNASANWTVNLTGAVGVTLNSIMQTGQSMTVAFLVTQGGTAYYNSAVQVDGSAVTPKWQGGTAPTSGNASSIDVYVYTVIKTANATFTVLASQTKFA